MKLAAGLLVLSMGVAHAHFSLLAPASAWRTDNGGKGDPPCGDGIASGDVTEVQGGHPLPLRLREFVFHPGHYRIALAVNSRSELPPDPDVVEINGASVRAAIQNPARIPVLADGLFAHTAPTGADWQTQIVLPNLNCEKCTLQIIEFMAEHGAPFFYRHCADLKIKADPALPAADSAWPRSNLDPGRPTGLALSHLADGGGWRTAITIVNLDSSPASFTLKFWGDAGVPIELPLSGLGRLSSVSGTVRVGGSQTIQTDGSPPTASTGWAELSSAQFIDGTAIFRFENNGQEASVPLLSGGGRRLILPFENGPALSLGIAIANIGANDDTTVAITVRNELGEVIANPAPVTLARRQHRSFVLAVPSNAQRGVVELDSSNADVQVLGIRGNNGAFTSIRALIK